MIERLKLSEIISALERQAAVALLGPRQVGKTTLAQWFGENRSAIYLDLEDPDDRQKLQNPAVYLEAHEGRLVIMDEIHRVPDLFPALRGIIDRGRRKGLRTGRFLLLGSASLDLLRQAGETLAGRIRYIELPPLMASEIEDTASDLRALWLRGGYPDVFLAESDDESFQLRKDLIQSYLDRDVRVFSPRIPSETLRRLWTMLAHEQGGLLNASSLGQALQTSTQSVTRYLDLLVDLLLVRRLTPYAINTKKRLVKSPKIYIRDSGLLHTLLNIATIDDLFGHPVVGRSWEGFAIENLIASAPERTIPGFYRTSGGAEIDLLLELPSGAKWAIEVKSGKAPKVSKGFHSALEDIRPQKAFAVHSGDEEYPISATITAIPLRRLQERLQTLGT